MCRWQSERDNLRNEEYKCVNTSPSLSLCVSVRGCVLTSWFECDIINVDVYCSAHQDWVVTCCKKKNKGAYVHLYMCIHIETQENTHTHTRWLLLTVVSRVRFWCEDVQIIVQTSLIETWLIRLCFLFPGQPSTVKHIHTKQHTQTHTDNGIIKPLLKKNTTPQNANTPDWSMHCLQHYWHSFKSTTAPLL